MNGLHLIILQAVPRDSIAGYTSDILQAVLALLGVCALAVLVIRFMASRFPRFGMTRGPVRVLQRVVLEPRRTLYLVRVGPRLLLLGFGEARGPVLLAEIDPQSVPTSAIDGSELPKGTEGLFNRFIHRNEHGRGTS